MNTRRRWRLFAAWTGAVALVASLAAAQTYAPIATKDGVAVLFRDAQMSDGSGGHYFEQLLRVENRNSFPIRYSIRARFVCRDGATRDDSFGARLGAGQARSGELAGLWSRSCDGGAARVEVTELTVTADGPASPSPGGGGTPTSPSTGTAGQVTTLEVQAISGYEYADEPGRCCPVLFDSALQRDAAVARACSERGGYSVGPTRWAPDAYCGAERNPSMGYRYRCRALAEGTCHVRTTSAQAP